MRFVLTAALLLTVSLVACESAQEDATTTMPTTRSSMGMLNSTCPMSGKPVDPNAPTVSYQGYEIGFCCPGCLNPWESKSDAEKASYVSALKP